MNWLNEFFNSPQMRRVVVANYIDHVRQNNAFRGKEKYATIEEALQDFAQRTGLSEMQKRALRRDIFMKVAMDAVKLREKRDMKQVELGEAPPSVLPGVKPGSEREKLLRKRLKKDPAIAEPPDLPVDTGLADRGVENAISEAQFRPGLIIEAAEEGLFGDVVEEEEKPKMSLIEPKRPGRPGTGKGRTTSKEQRLIAKIKHLESEIAKILQPGSNLEIPIWSGEEFDRGEKLKSDLLELKVELAELTRNRRRKEEMMKPSAQAARNDVEFRTAVDDVLGIGKGKKHLQEAITQRKEAFQKLSDQGLQEVFDKAVKKFKKQITYRPSQGQNAEVGDYVKCMICDAKKKLWVYAENPAILPFWHLLTHEEELLGDVTERQIDKTSGEKQTTWKGKTSFHNELVNAYLKKYPGAFLEAREQELARTFESMVENSRGRSLLDPVHVATEQDKGLDYSDEALLESILYQLRRFGVDSNEKSSEEMAQEVLLAIKSDLDDAFPGQIPMGAEGLGEIGKLEDLEIPFNEFQKIFNEQVSETANWYRGTLLRRRPSRRREKVRQTSVSRQEIRKRTGKELEWEKAREELHQELGKAPTDKQIKDRLQEKHMVPVGLGIYGNKSCWKCGEVNIIYTHNSEESIDSVTCPKCGAYKEKLVGGKGDKGERLERWECPKCHESKILVIRDPNITQPEAARRYDIYCDERRIGDGPLAKGYSTCVTLVGHESTYTYTPVETQEETGLVTEQVKINDRVRDKTHGLGTIVWIEETKDGPDTAVGSKIWVDFDSGAGEKIKLADAVDHIIAISGKYYKLVGAKILPKKGEPEKTETSPEEVVSKEQEEPREDRLMVSLKDQRNNNVVKFLGAGDLDREYLFLHEVPGSQITKVSYFKERMQRRAQLLKRLANVQCDHSEAFWVYRKLSPIEEAGKTGITLREQYITHLQRRLARAALLKAILKTE